MIDREQYAAYLAMAGLADATIRVYTAMAVRWTDWAITHHRNPYQPEPLAVRAWSQTVTGTRASLAHARSSMAWWCRACGAADVSAAIPLPRKPSSQQPLLDRDQTIRLLEAADIAGVAGLACKVALYTAGRRAEVASLAWANIDLGRHTIVLTRPKVRDRLRLPLHPALARDFEIRAEDAGQWVFPGRNGGHVSPAVVWGWIRQVGDLAEVGTVTPHMLRRTALTEINDRTRDLRAAQLFAGHSSPVVTAGYTRVSDERLTAACEALDWAS